MNYDSKLIFFITNILSFLQQKSEQAAQDKWKLKEKEAQEKIEEDAKDLEKMASKQNLLQQKIAECTKKIQELGSLPSPDIYSKYQNLSTKNVSIYMVTTSSANNNY